MRGRGTKKKGHGQGNWGSALQDDEHLRTGHMDARDPNYSSSSASSANSSEDDDRLSTSAPLANGFSRAPSHPVLGAQQPHAFLPPTRMTSEPAFKRIDVEQLFKSANGGLVAPASSGSTSAAPTPAMPAPVFPTAGAVAVTQKSGSEQYAGGAHHNIPDPQSLPQPSTLSALSSPAVTPSTTPQSTPQKQQPPKKTPASSTGKKKGGNNKKKQQQQQQQQEQQPKQPVALQFEKVESKQQQQVAAAQQQQQRGKEEEVERALKALLKI